MRPYFIGLILSLCAAPVQAELQRVRLSDSSGAWQVWTVGCTGTLCTASTYGLTISLNTQGMVEMTYPLPEDARISLTDGVGTLDMPDLFSLPLTESEVLQMSLPNRRILIEHEWRIIDQVPLTGLSKAFQFLKQNAAGIADQAQPPAALMHISSDRGFSPTRSWALVPHTKPQIEFAARAQGGAGVRLPGRHSEDLN